MTDDTSSPQYADRLERLSGARWKQVLDVQRPYRWNMRRMGLGATLDVGCGIGRHLENLPPGSVGVDHNAASIGIARSRGLDAYTAEEFSKRPAEQAPEFDSLLLSHVLEHMPVDDGLALLREYLPHVRQRVAVICPQERGYASDSTHVVFLDKDAIATMLETVGLQVVRAWSFPLPRAFGRVFTHNDQVVLADKKLNAAS
jgi:2-polyprenyl-3-methyl-5-hydroxy-6-metoxy-1,4-benzoquinol methylase